MDFASALFWMRLPRMKATKPPLLPEKTLARVLRTARLDGVTVVAIAGAAAVFAALGHSGVGVVVGLVISGAGAMELHGAHVLDHGEPRGMRWLIGAQLALMAGILGYCAWRLGHFEPELVRQAMERMNGDMLAASGLTVDELMPLMRTFNLVTYTLVALVSIVFQGGMIRYYLRRQEAVERALQAEWE